jgi:hypothetical protein
MPNVLYRNLLETVSSFIGEDKADTVLKRQLERCDATPDTVTADNLKALMNFVIGGAGLYLHPDKAKQAELTGKIKSLVD